MTGLNAQTVIGTSNLTFVLGIMADNSGAPLADGSLLQILAGYQGTSIAAPTPGDFLGGDTGATVLWQGSVDSITAGGVAGGTIVSFDVNIYANGTANQVTAGTTLFARWYPSLSTASSTPGSTTYGQYGYASASGALLDSSWVVPTIGQTIQYNFVTTSGGGTLDDTLGKASNVTAVPEPATTATILGGLGLAAGWFYRRRRN